MCSGPRIGKLLMMGRCIDKGESKSENGCNSLSFVCMFVYTIIYNNYLFSRLSEEK